MAICALKHTNNRGVGAAIEYINKMSYQEQMAAAATRPVNTVIKAAGGCGTQWGDMSTLWPIQKSTALLYYILAFIIDIITKLCVGKSHCFMLMSCIISHICIYVV